MTALTTRLFRLESLLTLTPGCHVCRYWTDLTICNDLDICLRPETCEGCGRFVPIVERRIFVGIDLETI